MFDRHRIRRWRIGHEDQLARLTRDDLWAYYRVALRAGADHRRHRGRRRCRPGAGARACGLRRLAGGQRRGGSLAGGARAPRGPGAHRSAATSARPSWSLGWRAVPPAAPRRARAGPGGGGARLRPGELALPLRCASPASSPGSRPTTTRRPSWACSASAASSRPTGCEAAVSGVAETVARLTLLGPTDEDLERARTLLRARWARRLESMEGRASALAGAEALEDVGLLDREYAAPRRDHRRRSAGGRRAPSRSRTRCPAWPTSRRTRASDLTADALGARVRGHRAAPPAPIGRHVAARSSPPRLRPPGARPEHGVTSPELPGADLLVRRKTGRAARHPRHLRPPRCEFDPPAQAGLGSLLVRAAVRGAGELDAAALAFAFERLGGTLGYQLGLRLAGLRRLRAGGAPGRGGHAAGHRFPPPPPARRRTSRPSVSS